MLIMTRNGHIRKVHVHNNETHGDRVYCSICGLFICGLCGGSESNLTTECSSAAIPLEIEKLIYEGVIDFKEGRWRLARWIVKTAIKAGVLDQERNDHSDVNITK